MHDPVGLSPFRRLPTIENERLFDADLAVTDRSKYRLIGAGGFPVTGRRGPIRPCSIRILPIPRAEEVPLLLPKYGLT